MMIGAWMAADARWQDDLLAAAQGGDGQAGGGLEIRLGKRFAISADLRGDARYRLTKPDEATAATLSINGKPFAPMDNQYGLQFRAGAAVYF